MTRKIIHIDMDAFYASVEQRDNLRIQGKPVIVGGSPERRGVVCSASYEARKFGVRSAMSSAQAQKLCPQGIFVQPNFDKYVHASRLIRKIFLNVTELVEPLSLDEAYLDVTSNKMNEPLAQKIAAEIRKQIWDQLHLTASAGVGPNKFIAKLASDMKKPNALVVVPPERVFQLIEKLPVEKFWGVGPSTTKRLHEAKIFNAEDIRKCGTLELEKVIGSYGSFLYELAHGRDTREVDPTSDPKSRGTEITFDQDVLDVQQLSQQLELQADEVSKELIQIEKPGRTITLRIKYSDFIAITRSQTLFHPTDDSNVIFETAKELLFRNTEVGDRPVRLIGISVGNLISDEEPLQLWFDFKNRGVHQQ